MNLASVLRSEFTKMASLRSTRWTLLALVVVTVGFGSLFAWGSAQSFHSMSAGDQADYDPIGTALGGFAFGQLAIAVLGVLTISGEYGTGAIRGTFISVPRRGLVLVAKGLLVTVTGLLFGWACSFGLFYVTHPIYEHYGLAVGLGTQDVLRALVGAGPYLAASGLFGFALGALLRRSAGAITAAVAGLLVVPPFLDLLPGSWGNVISRYFTSNAGQQISHVVPADNALGPFSGFGVYCAWWAVILAVAAVLVQRRDA